jgi:hypothetical protein
MVAAGAEFRRIRRRLWVANLLVFAGVLAGICDRRSHCGGL